jgi:hypothetical protein
MPTNFLVKKNPNVPKFFIYPTNSQVIILKSNIKINIKIAPTRFGAFTPSQGAHYSCLLKLHLVKMVNYGTSVCD